MKHVSAESFRIAATSLLLAMGSFQVLADTANPASTASSGTSALNPASAFTRAFGGPALNDGSGTTPPPRHHHRPHHGPTSVSTSTNGSTGAASWVPQAINASSTDSAPSAAAEPAHESASTPIASTFSKAPAETHVSESRASESRIADWLPSSETAAPAQETISTSARIDLIEEKYGKQDTVDFNSRIQEANGVIAFRAINNQSGERETIRVDRAGEIKLKSGWPE